MLDKIMAYFDANVEAFVGFGLKVVITIIVFIIGSKIIKKVVNLSEKWMEKAKIDKGVQQFICSLVRYSLYLLLVVSIAVEFGLNVTSIAALFASAGVAIGLALQGSLSNFAGGVLILVMKPFAVGDYILEDTNKNEGVVKEIEILFTKLQTVDNKIIIIPNGILANASLINITGQETRRLDLSIGISYSSDLLKAKEILMNILTKTENVDQEKDLMVMVEDLGDSAVVLGCRSWVKTENYWATRWALLEEIKLTFDKEGIEIPFNQLQVHLNQN